MKNVFVKLTTEIQTPKGPVMAPKWVNMSRCQEIDMPYSLDGSLDWVGSVLTMNIPDCIVAVKETPDEILALLAKVNDERDAVAAASSLR